MYEPVSTMRENSHPGLQKDKRVAQHAVAVYVVIYVGRYVCTCMRVCVCVCVCVCMCVVM